LLVVLLLLLLWDVPFANNMQPLEAAAGECW
jgi:hypothetical protein